MDTIYLVASGDLRLSANQNCEAAQAEMEKQLVAAIKREGGKVKRAHPYDPVKKHGFIDSQKDGTGSVQQDSQGCARRSWPKRSGSIAITCCPGCWSIKARS